MRTALYFGMIALSLAAMIGAGMSRVRIQPRFGGWNACLIAGIAYLVAVGAIGLVLPTIDEVPEHFPAAVLWNFRLASLGAQLLLYTVMGVGFGLIAERVLVRSGSLQMTARGSIRQVVR
jgi:hypothetical protein